jgi:hypothetical protein
VSEEQEYWSENSSRLVMPDRSSGRSSSWHELMWMRCKAASFLRPGRRVSLLQVEQGQGGHALEADAGDSRAMVHLEMLYSTLLGGGQGFQLGQVAQRNVLDVGQVLWRTSKRVQLQ